MPPLMSRDGAWHGKQRHPTWDRLLLIRHDVGSPQLCPCIPLALELPKAL